MWIVSWLLFTISFSGNIHIHKVCPWFEIWGDFGIVDGEYKFVYNHAGKKKGHCFLSPHKLILVSQHMHFKFVKTSTCYKTDRQTVLEVWLPSLHVSFPSDLFFKRSWNDIHLQNVWVLHISFIRKMVRLLCTHKFVVAMVGNIQGNKESQYINRGRNARLSQVPLTMLLHSQFGHFQNARVS